MLSSPFMVQPCLIKVVDIVFIVNYIQNLFQFADLSIFDKTCICWLSNHVGSLRSCGILLQMLYMISAF